MQELFASGRVADIMLALMALEAIGLVLLARRQFVSPSRLMSSLANIGAGACLVLALRFALVGAPWPAVAAALVLALIAHVADTYFRLNIGTVGAG
jgi:hypothetical protein